MANAFDVALLVGAATLFALGLAFRARRLRFGQPEDRLGNGCERLKGLAEEVFTHDRILREKPEGLHHLLLFVAFAFPLAVIAIVQLPFSLPVFLAGPLSLLIEAAAVGGFYGTFRLFRRRYVEKPEQLDEKFEDGWIYGFLFGIFLTGFLTAALRVAVAGGWAGVWSPVALVLSIPLRAVPVEALASAVAVIWRVHLFLVVATLATVPFSKLSHIVFGSANIYFRNRGPKGAFAPIDVETAEVYGVGQVELFTWKQLLDLEACVRCGRCQAKCPAFNTEKTLNPKKVIQDLKDHLYAKTPALAAGKGDEFETPMIDGGGVGQEDIWSCTTCRHCMEVCPMNIEHVDKIVDMRRHLVLMEGQMPNELVTLNKNLENNFNPWGVGWSDRNDWIERRGVNPRVLTKEESPEFDVLFWIGCAGSYDDRYQRVVASTVRLMKKAGVSFGMMGVEEKCCGDPARATGNEYLYQTLVAENIAVMDGLGVKKIVTSCPHCLKTLANEYPQFGGDYEVVHHSDFLLALVEEGKLELPNGFDAKATLHDSCYLSRYAGITRQPRKILEAVDGVELVEMERTGEDNFCCGAGGGRMWMEEEGERMNNVRTGQALATGADTICTACPFCLTMLDDGVKAAKKEEDVKVLDLAEILERAVL